MSEKQFLMSFLNEGLGFFEGILYEKLNDYAQIETNTKISQAGDEYTYEIGQKKFQYKLDNLLYASVYDLSSRSFQEMAIRLAESILANLENYKKPIIIFHSQAVAPIGFGVYQYQSSFIPVRITSNYNTDTLSPQITLDTLFGVVEGEQDG